MESILVAVTLVSLLAAVVLGIAALRLSREERARTQARVAALAAAAAAPEPQAQAYRAESGTAREATPVALFASESASELADFDSHPVPERIEPHTAWRAAPASSSTPRSRSAGSRRPEPALDAATESAGVRAASPQVAHSFLEVDAPRPSEGRQRGLAAAAAVLLVVLGGGAYWLLSKDARTANNVSAATAPAPLELMSLRHERIGNRLTLSGLVRNPAGGAPVKDLDAVVFLFDAKGTYLSTARAGVDFTHLAPGDESPFVISVDAPSQVARYRISFRTDAGVLAHVDRRGGQQQPATAVAGT